MKTIRTTRGLLITVAFVAFYLAAIILPRRLSPSPFSIFLLVASPPLVFVITIIVQAVQSFRQSQAAVPSTRPSQQHMKAHRPPDPPAPNRPEIEPKWQDPRPGG